jgi:hypothetical protein
MLIKEQRQRQYQLLRTPGFNQPGPASTSPSIFPTTSPQATGISTSSVKSNKSASGSNKRKSRGLFDGLFSTPRSPLIQARRHHKSTDHESSTTPGEDPSNRQSSGSVNANASRHGTKERNRAEAVDDNIAKGHTDRSSKHKGRTRKKYNSADSML